MGKVMAYRPQKYFQSRMKTKLCCLRENRCDWVHLTCDSLIAYKYIKLCMYIRAAVELTEGTKGDCEKGKKRKGKVGWAQKREDYDNRIMYDCMV